MGGSISFADKSGMHPLEDKVRIKVDRKTLKRLQDGHGGWNPDMGDLIGKQLELKGISSSSSGHWKPPFVIYAFD